ncbi:MAG: hypothetical protein ABI346_04205 [Candidatus Baltobacteraceae bacterium]
MKRLLPFVVAVLATTGAANAEQPATVLPTEWTILAPAGPVARTGTLPQSVTPTADGKRLVVVEGGFLPPAIRILDPATLATERTVAVRGAFGEPSPDASGSGVWIGGAQTDTISHLDAATGTIDRTIAFPRGFWPSGMARSPDGKTIAVAGESADRLAFVDLASGQTRSSVVVGRHPNGVAWSADGRFVYVANWGDSTVSAVDIAGGRRVVTTITVGLHPEAIVAAPGNRFFVALADDDAVAEIDGATGRVTRAGIDLFDGQFFGASPNALALSEGGSRLYVSCAGANAVAVFGTNPLHPLGAIPVGWYPTAVALAPDGGALYVADGKGERSPPNAQFDPFGRAPGYVAAITVGSVRRLAPPTDAALGLGFAAVRAGAGPQLLAALGGEPASVVGEEAGGLVVRANGPIHHVIYIIKENRTYDQVLGDMPDGDGDPSLVLFGERVTPNQHALAERFGVFDNAFADAQVSANGHSWSTAAFANDYLEKMWPQNYGGRRPLYDFEDGADAAVPHAGYLWDLAARAGITYRNYGEFTTEGATPQAPVSSHMPNLTDRTDPHFVGYDLRVRDEARVAEWRREFDAFERSGTLPALEIVRLPNDHTAATRLGERTPQAFVAENDVAFGQLVAVVSHSPDWKDTAIFAIEDDAQNGPDHVGAQRTTLYLASPYAKGGVHHAHYSTAGVLRTIELILGLPPMSVYDASARPLYAAFTDTADVRAYDALPPRVDLEARNARAAYRAALAARLDLDHADAVDDATMNDLIWHAVRGAQAPLPRFGRFPSAR